MVEVVTWAFADRTNTSAEIRVSAILMDFDISKPIKLLVSKTNI